MSGGGIRLPRHHPYRPLLAFFEACEAVDALWNEGLSLSEGENELQESRCMQHPVPGTTRADRFHLTFIHSSIIA